MSKVVLDNPDLRPRAVEGVSCIMLGMMLFVAQDGMMKSLLEVYPIWMLIGVRGVMALMILGPIILYLGGPHRLFSPLWPLHLLRAALFASGFTCFYTAFPFMGLAEISTIFFSAPLIIALMAAVFLGERIGLYRIGCLVVGFIGVVIAMNPTSDAFQWIALLPLFCALTYAMSQIIARQIGDRETTLTLGLYTIFFASVMVVPSGWLINELYPFGPDFHHLRWELPIPTTSEVIKLGALGAIGMVGYMLLSRAYQIASASLIAPFDYSYLPMATLMAYMLWGEIPSNATLIGMVLIVGSGLYLGYRELRSPHQTVEPRPVAEAVIAPGNPVAPMSLGAEIDGEDETRS